MPVESNISIDDRNFVPNVLREQHFRDRGYLIGESNWLHWIVIDPRRHPLHVWSKSGASAYVSSAKALNAVAFTNGPMMEHRDLAGRIAKGAGGGFVVTTAVTKYFAPAGPKGWALALGVGLVGALAGGAAAALTGRHGVPFKEVRGETNGIYDEGAKNTTTLYWLRREGGADFSNYDVGTGSSTPQFDSASAEVVDGLICLLKNFVPMSEVKGNADFNQPYADLAPSRASIWALIPFAAAPGDQGDDQDANDHALSDELAEIDLTFGEQGAPLDGVLLAAGGPIATRKMQQILIKIGSRDAVAMDGNESQMIGAFNEAFQESAATRELLLDYGFYCE